MSAKKAKKPQLKLVPSDVKQPIAEAPDELAILIRSINESARKAKAKKLKELQEVEPEPPMAA